MFDKFKALFGGDTDTEPQCRWLSAADYQNPYGIDGYDCVPYVSERFTSTADPEIAESFVRLRETEGLEYVNQLPPEAIELRSNLAYPIQGGVVEGSFFKASAMEEKWDAYSYHGRLYFARSWTGMLAYVAEFKISAIEPGAFAVAPGATSAVCVNRFWIAGGQADADEAFLVRQLDYLIKLFLFHLRVPHPLPGNLARDPDTVGAYSFNQYGNMCWFGSYEDTLPLELLNPKCPPQVM